MRTLNRYILRESLAYFLISLFAFTGVLLVLRMIKLAGLIINRGVEFQQIGRIFIAIIPTFLEIALPLSALLGIMLAFARLSGDSEVVVIRASGVSLRAIVPSILALGAVISIVGLYVSLVLRPWGFRSLSAVLFEIARTKSTAGLEEAVFNKLGDITLYAVSINRESGAIERVLVDDKRDQEMRRIIIARSGLISSDVEARTISLILKEGTIHEQVDGKYVLTNFDTNKLVLMPDELYGDQSDKRERKIAELDLFELDEMAAKYDTLPVRGGGDQQAELEALQTAAAEFLYPREVSTLNFNEVRRRRTRLFIEKGRRFSLPVSAALLALLGMALGIQPSRAQKTWGPSLSIGIGLLVFILYYVLFSTGITFAESGKISPLVGLWLPNIITLLLTLYLLWMVCSERWQSIAQGVEGLLTRFKRRTA